MKSKEQLINLPNGSWLKPSEVTAIRVLESVSNLSDRVVVHHAGDAVEVIPFPSKEMAHDFASDIGKEINETLLLSD